VLDNSDDKLPIISVATCIFDLNICRSRFVVTDCDRQSIMEASGDLFSVCYRANSEQDTSLCLAVLSLLWEIATGSHCDAAVEYCLGLKNSK
jgi:hypothetical protein